MQADARVGALAGAEPVWAPAGAPARGAAAAAVAACCTEEEARSPAARGPAALAHVERAAAELAPPSGTLHSPHSVPSPSAPHCSHSRVHPAPPLCSRSRSHWTRFVGSARPERAPRPSPTCAGRARARAAAYRCRRGLTRAHVDRRLATGRRPPRGAARCLCASARGAASGTRRAATATRTAPRRRTAEARSPRSSRDRAPLPRQRRHPPPTATNTCWETLT